MNRRTFCVSCWVGVLACSLSNEAASSDGLSGTAVNSLSQNLTSELPILSYEVACKDGHTVQYVIEAEVSPLIMNFAGNQKEELARLVGERNGTSEAENVFLGLLWGIVSFAAIAETVYSDLQERGYVVLQSHPTDDEILKLCQQ